MLYPRLSTQSTPSSIYMHTDGRFKKKKLNKKNHHDCYINPSIMALNRYAVCLLFKSNHLSSHPCFSRTEPLKTSESKEAQGAAALVAHNFNIEGEEEEKKTLLVLMTNITKPRDVNPKMMRPVTTVSQQEWSLVTGIWKHLFYFLSSFLLGEIKGSAWLFYFCVYVLPHIVTFYIR